MMMVGSGLVEDGGVRWKVVVIIRAGVGWCGRWL